MNCALGAGCEITTSAEEADFVVGMEDSSWFPKLEPQKKIVIVKSVGTSISSNGEVLVNQDSNFTICGSNIPLKDFLRVRIPVEGAPDIVVG
jgi:hypothetical protein